MRRRNAMVAAPLLVAVATAHVAGPARGADDADPIEIDLGDARILALSPDGRALAARASSGLCVYDVVTLDERACGDLDSHDVSLADDSVVWSPDSTVIAFAEDAFRTLRDGDLWVMDAATGDLTNVTDDGFDGAIMLLNSEAVPLEAPIYVDVAPSWAPDGRTIAFSRSSVVDGEFDGNEIARLDVDSGEVETLTAVTSDDPGAVTFGLGWSPDAVRVYYSVTWGDEGSNGIWELDTTTGRATQLLGNAPGQGPPAVLQVASSGTTALIWYPFHAASLDGGEESIALLDLESSTVSRVGSAETGATPLDVTFSAAFSPDGSRVLFGQRGLDEDRGGLFVRGLPDGQPEEALPGLDVGPSLLLPGGGLFWADDGTVFVGTSTNSGLIANLE